MALFTIADLHLSTLRETDKSMEIFGKRWAGYMQRLEKNWRHLVTDSDTVVIPGDISWALSLEEATSDLKFLDSLPGKKILGKGNHDFWWTTMRKHTEHFEKNGIGSISFLFNNAHETDDFIIAGTRGWFFDEKNSNAQNNPDFEKLTAREKMRLDASLAAARELSLGGDKEILAFMHFPPIWQDTVSEGLIKSLKEYGIKNVFYGHIHGNYTTPPTFEYENINFHIISADYLDFIPKIITKN